MTLIVEDGTIVPNADSYDTTANLVAYASKRGIDLSSETTVNLEVYMIKAMDYLEAKRDKYKGWKSDSDQSLQWPRGGVYVDNLLVGSDTIPQELKSAQFELAIETYNGNDLSPTVKPTDSGRVTEDTLHDVTTEKYDVSFIPDVPVFQKAENLLKPLCKATGKVIK